MKKSKNESTNESKSDTSKKQNGPSAAQVTSMVREGTGTIAKIIDLRKEGVKYRQGILRHELGMARIQLEDRGGQRDHDLGCRKIDEQAARRVSEHERAMTEIELRARTADWQMDKASQCLDALCSGDMSPEAGFSAASLIHGKKKP